MKKVIIAFDGRHFSEAAFDFVCQINKINPVLVTGIFLPGVDYGEVLYSLGGLGSPMYFQDIDVEDTGVVRANMDHFAAACQKEGIEYRMHPDIEKHILPELLFETRFADLLLVGYQHFYENMGEETQHDYIGQVLHKAECPVVLVPEGYTFPASTVIAYDGSKAAVHAMKQFAYLLPEFSAFKTQLVYAGSHQMPDLPYVEELGARHFSDFNIVKLDVDSHKYFNTWLQEQGPVILIAGAFGRSPISEMFKKSFISTTLEEQKFPVFVAHK